MVDIIHRIGIKAPATRVYQAVTSLEGLAHWWTEEVQGDEQVGGKIAFDFRTKTGELKGHMVMEVKERNAAKEVRWTWLGARA